MKAVITVVGTDTVGILAGVSNKCAEHGVNIIDVSQTVLQEMFCMIMIGDIKEMKINFGDFADELSKFGEDKGLSVHVMHEDLFNSMHRI